MNIAEIPQGIYEDAERSYQGPNYLRMAGDVTWSLAKWTASMETLGVLRAGAKSGFAIPFTRGGGKIGNFAMERGWWGPAGKTFMGGLEPEIYQTFARRTAWYRGGMLRLGSATRTAAATIGTNAAKNAAAKFVISRTAGFALGAINRILPPLLLWDAVSWGWGSLSRQVNKYRGLELGGYFPETQGAYTSRQRALQAITASRLQAKSAIGNEAQLFHR